jgi:hypothetical protein
MDAITQLCLSLLAATGLRVSELCGLRIGQVTLQSGEITVLGKGSRERVVIIANQHIRSALAHHSRIDGTHSDDTPPSRVPALLVEQIVQDATLRLELHEGDTADSVPAALKRVDLKEKSLELCFDTDLALQAAAKNQTLTSPNLMLARWHAGLRDGEELTDQGGTLRICTPLTRTRRGHYAAHFPAGSNQPRPDPILIAALARAHRWKQALVSGEVESIDVIATRIESERTHVGRTLRLAFLSPDLTRDLLEGRQPTGLTLVQLLNAGLPLAWGDQPAFLQALAQSARLNS